MHHINDHIFHFIYELALRDAALRSAYTGSIDQLRANRDAEKIVQTYIDTIMRGYADQDSFWGVEEQVEASFKKQLPKSVPPFTFGNVQKLINMATKYLFIACYSNDKLRERFRFCHCPMDSIMVDTAITELEAIDQTTLNPDDLNTLSRFLKRGNKTFLRRAWSKIESGNVEQYELYQEIIAFLAKRRGVCPIEYDYLMWNNHADIESDF